MSSRKSNKSIETEVEQVAGTLVEDVVASVEAFPEPEVLEQFPVDEEPAIEADAEMATLRAPLTAAATSAERKWVL